MVIRSNRLLSVLCALLVMVGLSASVEGAAQTCTTNDCHADFKSWSFVHEPVEDDCLSCHEQTAEQHPREGGSFRMVEQGSELCYQCHEPMGRKLTLHAPVQEGLCVDCHNPHGSNSGEHLLPVDYDLTMLCNQCHDSSYLENAVVHGPAASGACTQCHDPHESNEESLLKEPVQMICVSCHDDIAEGMKTSSVIHAAVEESSCASCHDPHSAPAPKLLQKDIEDLCLECHGDIGRNASRARVKHAAMHREEKCSACHATHFSSYSGLLKQQQQDVCLSCHGQDDYRKSKPLKNIAKELEGRVVLHGPVKEGDCSACHNPHGSNNTRMLVGAYPATFYHPYKKGSYDFCLECHDKNILRFAETSIYTAFRNGKQNLHHLHVANKYKGRSCRACHEAHAADLEKMMSEEGAQFGSWKIPTRYRKTETGGSCSPGCHQTYEYDRENPVDYDR